MLSQDISFDIFTSSFLEIHKANNFMLKRWRSLNNVMRTTLTSLLLHKRTPLHLIDAIKKLSKYHLIHLNEPFAGSIDFLLLPSIPKILTFHDSNIIAYSEKKLSILKHVVEKTNIVVVPSIWLKNAFEKQIGRTPVVIPHCVDLSLFNPLLPKSVAKRRFGVGDVKKVVIYDGRLDPDKDPATMIETLCLLLKEDQEIGFILKYRTNRYDPAYTMRILKSLRKISQSRANKNRFKFFHDIPLYNGSALYRAADVFFTTSPLESFSLATVEAMACGLPVVVPESSALPEVVGDGGLYCKVGDAESFAKNILRCLYDKKLAMNLVHRGLRRVIEKFHPFKISKRYIDLYNSIIGELGEA